MKKMEKHERSRNINALTWLNEKKSSNPSNKMQIYTATVLILLSLIVLPIPATQFVGAPPMTWSFENVDMSSDAGRYNSLAFDSNGIPHILYQRNEPFPNAVLHAYKIGDTWYNETVFEQAGIVGRYLSLAIDTNDVLHASFFVNDCLYYSNNATGIWMETIVDEDAWARVGYYNSIALDSSDNPRIAYWDSSQEDLKYAYYDGSTWNIDVVDSHSKDEAGEYCSLAIAHDDTPHISYHYRVDSTNERQLKHAWKTGNSWNEEVVYDQDIPGRFTCIAINNITGELHISHNCLSNKDLLYSNNSGAGWNTQVLDDTNDCGYYTSLTLDHQGEPHIVHFDQTDSVIKRTWRESGSWYTETVVSSGPMGNDRCLDIAMDSNNEPKISYYDANTANLMYSNGFVNFVDLTVNEVWSVPSGSVGDGEQVQIFANVSNLGSLESGPFIVRFYDGDPEYGGTQIGSDQSVSSLQPGNHTLVNVSWIASPIGSHQIYAEVNPDDVVLDPFQHNDKDHVHIEVGGFELKLGKGWHLISIPQIQDNTSLITVLASLSGYYDAVICYNGSDEIDPWKYHHTSKPCYMNDLHDIDHKMGFWIHITKEGGTSFKFNGTKPTESQNITLNPGWNLVGFPSLTNKTRAIALNNIVFGTDINCIWTYNSTAKKWQEIDNSDYFELGRGYWIHCSSSTDVVWEVPL